MQTKTKSILRYPGSKARFTPLIAEAISMNNMEGSLFAEPFCGGASVSISLLEDGIVGSVALNDVDPLIAALWETVFNASEAEWLADQVLSIPLNIEEWNRQKGMSPANRREAALKCLYLNRTSFNGIIHKSGPIGGWGKKSERLVRDLIGIVWRNGFLRSLPLKIVLRSAMKAGKASVTGCPGTAMRLSTSTRRITTRQSNCMGTSLTPMSMQDCGTI